MRTAPPPAAAEHHRLSALVAARAAFEAARARPRGPVAIAQVIVRHQAAGAALAQTAVGTMLDQQDIDSQADAMLNSVAFTTEVDRLLKMIDATAESELDRLAESLVQDASRAAESVAVAVRPDIRFVRYLSLPSCSRCAVLAGRVYRYSQGFPRHTNCDCVMLPTTVAAPDLVQDPVDLARRGLIHTSRRDKKTGLLVRRNDLSQADMLAIEQGADFGRVVNVRGKKAGLRQAGRVLARAGRPTPEGIYALAGDDREKAVQLLKRYGYVL